MYNVCIASQYPISLSFTIKFIRGVLAHIEIPQKIGFITEADAENYVAQVNRASEAHKVDYTITKYEIVANS